MSPKIHPEVHNIGKPSAPSKPIPVSRPGADGKDPCVTTIPGPVPRSPKHDPNVRVNVPDPSKGENYPSAG